jgi:hypothetical protein
MTPRGQLCAPLPPVHIAKSHGAMPPPHVIMHCAPSRQVMSLQSIAMRQSIVHEASSPAHAVSQRVLWRQSIAQSASVHAALQRPVRWQSTTHSLPAAQVAPHVLRVSLQSNAQPQPLQVSAQPAAGHSFAQHPEVQLAQLPTGQSVAQLHAVSPLSAQHTPLPHSCAPQSSGQLQVSSPASGQQMSSPQLGSPQSSSQSQLDSLGEHTSSPHTGSQSASQVPAPSPDRAQHTPSPQAPVPQSSGQPHLSSPEQHTPLSFWRAQHTPSPHSCSPQSAGQLHACSPPSSQHRSLPQ